MDSYLGEIQLRCPLCGNDTFSVLDSECSANEADENQILRCFQCKREATKVSIICDNNDSINAQAKDLAIEAIKKLLK